MTQGVIYKTLARLYPKKPVDRISFIADACAGKKVLDIGCYDETALIKQGTDSWLHGRIASIAQSVIGLDNSAKIPKEGIQTGLNSKIISGNGKMLEFLGGEPIDIIVAGEFIEHIDHPVDFILHLRSIFPGRRMILSTPNGVSFANTLLGLISREAQHPDHIQVFTYKILNTLCQRANLVDYKIIPYRFFATEMILESKGFKKIMVQFVEKIIRFIEKRFPLLSFGYIIDAKL